MNIQRNVKDNQGQGINVLQLVQFLAQWYKLVSVWTQSATGWTGLIHNFTFKYRF